MRDFVFGSNQTGLVTSDNNVVGGQDPALAGDVFPAPDGIVVGTSGSATGTYTAPTASIAAWKSFIGEVVATAAAAATASSTGAKPTDENGAWRFYASSSFVGATIVVFTVLLF
jgi:carboxypeptidase D